MNKLEEGMYVRYKYENCIYIGKIKFICEVMGFEETLQMDIDNSIEEILKEDIIKSSYNIIDLIEEGDIVDKKEVINVYRFADGFNRIELFGGKAIMNKTKIKSIVTKEQFESMKYEVSNE